MTRKTLATAGCFALLLWLGLAVPGLSQEMFRPPETILPQTTLRLILDEVSGQLAYNNEVTIAGYNRIRTPEEMTGVMFEARVLHEAMRAYGLDELTLESLTRPDRKTWWVGHDAELRLVAPETRLLARLAEQPALLVRGSDTVDCEGEVVFVDRRDVPKLKDMDFDGKIVLTPEYPGRVTPALEQGALGFITYHNSIRPLEDPDQVMFEMSTLDKMMSGGRAKGPVVGMCISTREGLRLRDMVIEGQKVIVRMKTVTKEYPWKADTIFAAIRGTAPEKKGLMFTAHLFERLVKIGANDNISGCVVLAEIARTLAAMVRDGRVPRPERSIYFLMSEEYVGTGAFFKSHPEMAAQVLGDFNMDMVGENLDANSANFCIECPPFSRATYLDAVARSFAEYVYRTNIYLHDDFVRAGELFPIPILEKNGSRQPFRYIMMPFNGGSDHQLFIDADAGIPALSLMVGPDFWNHTDKDTPDKTDPTQLKRAALIGAGSALAVCDGSSETLERLSRTAWLERRRFVADAYAKAANRVAARTTPDGGRALRDGLYDIVQAVAISRFGLSGIYDLTAGKRDADRYLHGLIEDIEKMGLAFQANLTSYDRLAAEARGQKPQAAAPPSAADKTIAALVPKKAIKTSLGEQFPYSQFYKAMEKEPELHRLAYTGLGSPSQGLSELLMLADGTRTLKEIRDILSFEFQPVESEDLLKGVKALEAAKLITLEVPAAAR